MTILHNQRRMTEFVQSSYGNAQRKKSINRERVAGHTQLVNDYFSAEPVYTYDMFRWQFRMRKMLRIVTDLKDHPDVYFKLRKDATKRKRLSPLQKWTTAIRQLAYGGPADQLDEYLRMAEWVKQLHSNACQTFDTLMQIYGRVYLRNSMQLTARLLQMHEQRHSFSGMLEA